MKSKIISLSAISASLTAICLTFGAYFEFADIFAIVLSSVFVILPLYFRSYKGSLLCFLAGGLIAFLFSGFNILSLVFPSYFGFFGIYPIFKFKLIEKNFNKRITFILGLLWFVIIAYGVYFYYSIIIGGVFNGLPSWIVDYALYFVGVVAVIFFFVYDRFIYVVRFFINKYLNQIIK